MSIIKIIREDSLKCKEPNEINTVIENFDAQIVDEEFDKIVFYTLIHSNRIKMDDGSLEKLRIFEVEKIWKQKELSFNFGKEEGNFICNEIYPLLIEEKKKNKKLIHFAFIKVIKMILPKW